jgi:hypothetical protein
MGGKRPMKQSILLSRASMLSVLFMSLHLADDIVRGFEAGGPSNLLAVPILVLWLYATLVLAERIAGYVIVLLASLMGTYVPILHFRATGGVAGGAVAASDGAFLWVWTLIALGVSATLTAVLAAQALWKLRHGASGEPQLRQP